MNKQRLIDGLAIKFAPEFLKGGNIQSYWGWAAGVASFKKTTTTKQPQAVLKQNKVKNATPPNFCCCFPRQSFLIKCQSRDPSCARCQQQHDLTALFALFHTDMPIQCDKQRSASTPSGRTCEKQMRYVAPVTLTLLPTSLVAREQQLARTNLSQGEHRKGNTLHFAWLDSLQLMETVTGNRALTIPARDY